MTNYKDKTPADVLASFNKMTDEQKEIIRKKIERNKRIINDPKINRKILDIEIVKRIQKESLYGEIDNDIPKLSKYDFPHDDIEMGRVRESHYESAQEFKDIVDKGIEQNMVFYGRPGTGKTYLAKSLAKQLIHEGKSVLFLNMIALKNVAYKFNERNAQAKLDRIKRYAAIADLMILDDLGAESNGQSLVNIKEASQTMQSLLYELANRRMKKPILITTNLGLDFIKDIYQEQVISRLLPKNRDYVCNFNQLNDLRNGGLE